MPACNYALAHLSDAALLRDLAALVARYRAVTSEFIAHLAEVDARRLYLPAGYPSMFEYCVRDLGFSEDAAYKWIRAARAARQVPALFAALAGGRLHLSGVVLLAPHITPENSDELLAGVERKTKSEIEAILAQRFPRPDVPPRIEALPGSNPLLQQVLGRSDAGTSEGTSAELQLAPGPVGLSTGGADGGARGDARAHENAIRRSRATPLAPARFALQLTIDEETHNDLQYAQALLSHQVTSGDLADVLKRALKAAIPTLEKDKFAATGRPRTKRRLAARTLNRKPAAHRRAVPAHVKRAVWRRDEGQCTFVGTGSRRCSARRFLEFDHVDPVARGGTATVENIRLRCRAHNQYTAEREFGEAFMRGKRDAARRARASYAPRGARTSKTARHERTSKTPPHDGTFKTPRRGKTPGPSRSAIDAVTEDIIACMRSLGCTVSESRRAARYSERIPGAPIEERVRLALSTLGSKAVVHAPPARGVATSP